MLVGLSDPVARFAPRPVRLLLAQYFLSIAPLSTILVSDFIPDSSFGSVGKVLGLRVTRMARRRVTVREVRV